MEFHKLDIIQVMLELIKNNGIILMIKESVIFN